MSRLSELLDRDIKPKSQLSSLLDEDLKKKATATPAITPSTSAPINPRSKLSDLLSRDIAINQEKAARANASQTRQEVDAFKEQEAADERIVFGEIGKRVETKQKAEEKKRVSGMADSFIDKNMFKAGVNPFVYEKDEKGAKPGTELGKPDPNSGKFAADSYSSLMSGLSLFNAKLTRIPSLIYETGAYPQNKLAELTGWPVGARSPEWLANSKISKYYDESAEAYDVIKKEFPNEDLFSLVQKKNYKDAARYLWNQVLVNAPQQALTVSLALSGVGAAATLTPIMATVASGAHAETRGKLSDTASIENALSQGALEGIFERFGTFGIANWAKRVFAESGKTAGKSIIKNSLNVVFKSALGEGFEEVGTQIAQDMTAEHYGAQPVTTWKEKARRAIDAGAIGAVSGGAMTASIASSAGTREAKQRANQEKYFNDLMGTVQEYIKEQPNEPAITTVEYDKAKADAESKTKPPAITTVESEKPTSQDTFEIDIIGKKNKFKIDETGKEGLGIKAIEKNRKIVQDKIIAVVNSKKEGDRIKAESLMREAIDLAEKSNLVLKAFEKEFGSYRQGYDIQQMKSKIIGGKRSDQLKYSKQLSVLGGEAKVTVYRGIKKEDIGSGVDSENKIYAGDFVSLNRNYSNTFGDIVIEDTVSASDLRVLSGNNELIYSPSSEIVEPDANVKAEKALTADEAVKKKAKIIKKVVEVLPEDEGALRSLTEKIATGEAGKRIPTEEGYTGYSSTFPKYFQNKGYTKAGVLDIINKVEKGQSLTPKQEAIFRDLMKGEKADIQKEIEHYERQELEERKQLRAEGITESEIDKVIQSGESAAQSEVDVEGVGEIDFEFGENVPTEKTPSGEQILIKGTEGREFPKTPSRAKVPQKEGDLLSEFKGETNEQMQRGLFEKPEQKASAGEAPAYQRGGESASIGDYPNIENLTEKTSGLPDYKIVPFPEIVRFYKDLIGKVPHIKRYLYGAKGRAHLGSLDIELMARAFEKGPEEIAKILSHELGHIADWLPEGLSRKGNLLGRIASLNNYLKHYLSEFPGSLDNTISPKTKQRLRAEAKKLSAVPVHETQEIIIGEKLPTPDEILAIWNTTTASIDNPDLLDYIKTLSDELKKDIVKAAFKNTIPKWVTFKKQIKETITVGTIRSAPEDIQRLYKELLRNEIIKRRLFDINVIRKELQALSAEWRPFDRIKSSPNYVEYRDKPKELYADAISVLFNDPVRLKTSAPEFYRGFFNYLNQKPGFAEEYAQMQNLLSRGSEEMNKARMEDIYKGFEKGAEKRKEAFNEKIDKKSVLFRAITQHVTKFHPIYHELDEAIKAGKISLSRKQVVRETLEAMSYKRNDVWLDLERNEKEVMEPLKKVGISENQLGAWFMLERNLGDRIDIANPGGLIGRFNEEVKAFLSKNFTIEQSETLKKAVSDFHKATFEIAEKMHEQGMIPNDVWTQKIVPYKDSYVSYGVVKYIEKNYVTPYVKQMTGTLEEIENPLVTTMYKRGAMLQALATHKAKSEVISLLKLIAPDEIQLSKSVMGIKHQRIFQKTPGKEQLILQEKGQWVSYDVDPYFAEMFKQFDHKDLHTLAFLAGQFNRYFKPVVTTYKIGWAAYNNPAIDIQRTLKNLAAISKLEGIPFERLKFLKDWIASVPQGFKFSGGRLTPLAKEALGKHAITTPWVSYDPTAGEDKALYTLYQKYRVGLEGDIVSNKRITQKFLLPVEIVLKALERIGGTFESTSKLAGFKYLSKRLEDQGKAGFYNRNYIGTPNYLEGGSMKEIDNNILVFSNVIIQGLRSESELLRNPKSRGAWIFESFLQAGIWKLLMLVGASGLLGKAIKDGYDDITEYHKTNFLSFPIATLSNGKTLYWTVPQDETNRLAGSIIWKTGTALRGKLVKPQQVLDIGAGFVPSLTPIFDIIGAWFEYIRGKNPWNSYYGRNVLDQQTEQIRGLEGAKKMALWTINAAGLGNFATYDPATKTTFEKTIQYTPLINRIFKVSDYGITEKEIETEKKEKQKRAIQNKEESDLLGQQVDEYIKLGGNPEDYKREIKIKLYPDGAKTSEEKSNLTRLKTDFDQEVLKRTSGDSRVKTIMRLQLSSSKIEALKKYSNEMRRDLYIKLLDDLAKAKVISWDVYKEAIKF